MIQMSEIAGWKKMMIVAIERVLLRMTMNFDVVVDAVVDVVDIDYYFDSEIHQILLRSYCRNPLAKD